MVAEPHSPVAVADFVFCFPDIPIFLNPPAKLHYAAFTGSTRTSFFVTNAANQQSCWPNQEQELLLRAALLRGADSLRAWEQWRADVDIDHLDVGSQRLLPLLYRNLSVQGVADPLMTRYKGAYRRTWYDNQLLIHRVSDLLRCFSAAGIETLVLKGAALALRHYGDLALRPMSDLDVMVPLEKSAAAIRVMTESGWQPLPRTQEGFNERYLEIVHAHGFTHPGRGECDLHWHLFPECCEPDADNDFWEQAVPFELNGVATRTLSPTDQLMHVCVHGAAWNPIPPIRWVADAMTIMNSSSIDWKRMVTQAQKRRLMLSLRGTLQYLSSHLAAPVPLEILDSLEKIPYTRTELAEYRYKTENYEPKALGFLPLLWFRYLRLHAEERPHRRLIGFGKYLMGFWGADHMRELPSYAARMALRRVRVVTSSRIVSRSATDSVKTAAGNVQEQSAIQISSAAPRVPSAGSRNL